VSTSSPADEAAALDEVRDLIQQQRRRIEDFLRDDQVRL
jgi:hypothetical protein